MAGYGQMAEMLGKQEVAEKYIGAAKDMAREWIKMADDGDHYRLTFDLRALGARSIIWYGKSIRYGNLPGRGSPEEVAFYLTKQQKYGLPWTDEKIIRNRTGSCECLSGRPA